MASKFNSCGRTHICIIHCIHIESSESCSSKPSLQRIPIKFHRNVNKTRLWMESPFIMYRYSFQIVVVCTFQNTEEFLWWWIPRTTPTPVIKRKFKNTSQPSRWSLHAYAVSDFPALLSVTHISSDGSLFWLVTTLSSQWSSSPGACSPPLARARRSPWCRGRPRTPGWTRRLLAACPRCTGAAWSCRTHSGLQ